MYYWLIIGLTILVLLPILYFKRNSNWCIVMLYIAGVFAFFPMFYSIYRLGGIPVSLVFPAQLFAGGVEYKNFIEIINSVVSVEDPKRSVVMFCCTLIYVLAPVFTIGFIFNYVRKSFDSLFLRSLINKEVYVFSEFNDNSLVFAESLKRNNKKCVVIFAKSEKHPEYKGFLFAEFSVERMFLIINRTNTIHLIFTDKDEDEALNRFFKFKEKERKKKVEVYVYSTKREAEYIIDEVKKTENNLNIQLVNTEQLLVLDTLWNYPLYMNMGDKKEFNITVFGVGNMGASFVKDALWCTSLADYGIKLNLIDKGNAVSNLVEKCPYINVNDANINVICENVCTEKLDNIISDESVLNTNYIFISLGDDSLNVDMASRLRLKYLRMDKNPIIVTVIENDSKREILEKIFKDDEIRLTGNISQFCDFEYMMKNNVFRFGYEAFKVVENHYAPGKEVNYENFCMQNQTEIYSSLSNAVHMKYKIFSLLGDSFDYERDNISKLKQATDAETKEKLIADIKNEKSLLEAEIDKNIDKLSKSEHIRWGVFERLKGFIGEEYEELENFISGNSTKVKLHKDLKLKKNACITEYENLDKVDELIKKYSSDSNVESVKIIDELMTRKIPEIWYKEIEDYV